MFPMTKVEPAGEAPAGNEALIAALEAARSALDDVEAAATGARREKLKAPPVSVEIETEDDSTETE
jgi:hypothetical protein